MRVVHMVRFQERTSISAMPVLLPERLRRSGVAGLMATVGVLLGLFGMHVLNLHGVQHESDSASVAGAARMHGDHEVGASPLNGPASASEAAVEGCCDHGHGMSAMVLCLALLVGVGVGALVVLATAVKRRAKAQTRDFGLCRWWTRSTARAGPPYAMAFSVIRC